MAAKSVFAVPCVRNLLRRRLEVGFLHFPIAAVVMAAPLRCRQKAAYLAIIAC